MMSKKTKKKLSIPEIVTHNIGQEYLTVLCPEDGCNGEMFYTSYSRKFEEDDTWQMQHVCSQCCKPQYYEGKYPRIEFFSGNRKVCTISSNSQYSAVVNFHYKEEQ